MSQDCSLLNRACVSDMIPSVTSADLRGWRCNYDGAYIIEMDERLVFNTTDFQAACDTIHQSLVSTLRTVIRLTLAPERRVALEDDGVVPRLHLDHLRHVNRVLYEMREGRMIVIDELYDDEELVTAIRSVADDISVSPAPGTGLGVAQDN
jgi:hypothetical protein